MTDATPTPQMLRLAERFGHRFADPALLIRACTHRSHGPDNNERLEYLGDALLGLVIAAEVYERRPMAHEGVLSRLRSRLVRETSLAELARALDFGDALQLGEGELHSGGFRRASILADAFEALLGAVYRDAGFDAARRVCLQQFAGLLDHLPAADELKDPKTRLQECLQATGRPLPQYVVLEESGPPHKRHFRVSCELEDGSHSEAGAGSRRQAEQEAAAKMLERLEAAHA
ncbi:MAG TPA: ribonuclease III [Nevskiaceae bacterium]|nr:ribonuclease III [Nevskiaceae bacterium]